MLVVKFSHDFLDGFQYIMAARMFDLDGTFVDTVYQQGDTWHQMILLGARRPGAGFRISGIR
jgi:hypothetical protein